MQNAGCGIRTRRCQLRVLAYHARGHQPVRAQQRPNHHRRLRQSARPNNSHQPRETGKPHTRRLTTSQTCRQRPWQFSPRAHPCAGGGGGGPSQTKHIFFFRFFSRSTMYQANLWHTLNCTQCSGTGIQWRRKRRQDVQGDTISVYIGTPETCKTCKGKGTKPCKTPRQTKTKPQS